MTAILRERFDWWALQTGTTNGTVTADTAVKYAGASSAKCKTGEASRYQYTISPSLIKTGEYFYYWYAFRADAKPAANEGIMRFRDTTGTMGELAFRTTGKLNFFNSVAGANVGAESGEITLGKWYIAEVKIRIEAAGVSKIGWRILNEDGSTFFAEQSAEQSMRNIGVKEIWFGHMGTGAFNIWVDALGINNSLGSSNNNWPAELVPTLPAKGAYGCYLGAAMDGDVGLLEGKAERGDAPYVAETWNLFEEHAGRTMGIVHFSDPWRKVAEGGLLWDGFGANAALKCYERGAIAMKSIGSTGEANFIKEVNEGKFDAQLKTYFTKAKEYGKPFFFRLWWEMNGTWWVWSSGATSSEYVTAWQRVFNIAQEQGATNATFVWCPNRINADDPERWYPGDAYVHWVGFDAYNGEHPKKKEGWRTPESLIGPTYTRLLEIAPTKPLLIGEMASSEYFTTTENYGHKPAWLEELFATIKSTFPGIKAFVWYNEYAEHEGGRVDWPIESYPKEETTNKVTREAFAKAAKDLYFIGPIATNFSNLTTVPELKPPTVTTSAATSLANKSAALQGLVNPNNQVTNYWFEWGKTSSYGNKTPSKSAGSGSANVSVSEVIESLKLGTTYHFRLVAESASGTTYGADEILTTTGSKVVRSKKPSLALDVEVETADGDTFRLSSGSRKAKSLPRNLWFGTNRGEGFGQGGLNLGREIFKGYPDIGLLDTWRAISRTGKVVYESRLQSTPRTNDPEELIEIALIGWMSYLAGRKISPLICDSRQGSWEGQSLQRKTQLNALGWNLSKMGVSSGWQGDAAGPNEAAIIFTPADWANNKFRGEQWFNGHGEIIERVLYNFLVLNAGGMAEFLSNAAVLTTSDTVTAATEGTNHKTTAASNQNVTRTAKDARYAYIKSARDGGAYAGESSGDSWAFSALKVIGAHGLTLRGTWPEVGFYLTDIIQYILETYYPKVKLAGDFNDFIVQQATWHDSAAPGYDIVKQLNNLALWELNMWEERTLYHEPADLTDYDWQFKTTDPGVKVKFQGDSIENFANGCSVQFTDFDDVTHILYPSDHEELRDESRDNPYNLHGEAGWTHCDVPYQCNMAEALQFGRIYLAEFNRPKRPGAYEIQGGYIKDAAGNWQAGFDPRNGETVGITDLLTDEPRLITSTNWNDETKILTLTVDAPDRLLDAIVARQQIARETRAL